MVPVVCCRILSNSAPNSASADIRLKAWESSKGFQFCFLPPGATVGGSDVNVDDEELELVRYAHKIHFVSLKLFACGPNLFSRIEFIINRSVDMSSFRTLSNTEYSDIFKH